MNIETMASGALMLLIGAVVVAVVGYDIYLHPPDPATAGTATVEVTGTGRFTGEVGTDRGMAAVEGTAPFSIEVAYRRSDYVSASIDLESPGTARIRVGCRTVEEGAGRLLVWKPPVSWERGVPPKGWSKCEHAGPSTP